MIGSGRCGFTTEAQSRHGVHGRWSEVTVFGPNKLSSPDTAQDRTLASLSAFITGRGL